MAQVKLIYVCSPLRGDIEGNIAKAREHCKAVMSVGHMPIAPHVIFDGILNDNVPHERETTLHYGLLLVNKCDELWIFGGIISDGMKAEIELAKSLNIPVKSVLYEGVGGASYEN